MLSEAKDPLFTAKSRSFASLRMTNHARVELPMTVEDHSTVFFWGFTSEATTEVPRTSSTIARAHPVEMVA